jgi:hypothetical protein
VILDKSWIWGDDIYTLEVNIDDPSDRPLDANRYLLAALPGEGLVLQEGKIRGERLYRRIGHYVLYDSQVMERRPR